MEASQAGKKEKSYKNRKICRCVQEVMRKQRCKGAVCIRPTETNGNGMEMKIEFRGIQTDKIMKNENEQ